MTSCATPYYMCDVLDVLHVSKYRHVTHVTDTCVIHNMFYTWITCVGYTPVLHMQFYIYITCVGYTPALHVWNITGVYTCTTII